MKLTIIIPHKNSAALLRRLLDSIPTELNAQVIVVDDNSKVEEYEAVKSLVSSYGFELYKNEGKFAGGARNTALKHANGEWLLFSDADDYLLPAIKDIFEKYQDMDYDLVYCNVTSIFPETGKEAYRHLHVKGLIEKALSLGDMNCLRCCYTSPVAKFVKRKVVEDNNILFDEVIAGNDMWFSVRSGLAADKVACVPEPIYCITVTGNSITTTLSEDRFESRLQVSLRVNNLLRKNNMHKYQISVLYFLGKAYQFGFRYMLHVWWCCLKNKSNPFIGIKKMLNISEVMKDRQNTTVSKQANC